MSRGKKSKTTKVAESKSVLDVEFLSKTFNFDFVLTTQTFCVALHQSFGMKFFHLEIHNL